MRLEDKLSEEGIRPRSYDSGTQKIKCPQCQPNNHNPKDNPLSLTINDIYSAVWFCHHCEYKGGHDAREKDFVRQITKPDKPIEKPVMPNKN